MPPLSFLFLGDFKYSNVYVLFMETKNSLNEARKLRRKFLNARNLERCGTDKKITSKDRNSKNNAMIDLSKKDNKSGRGRYV